MNKQFIVVAIIMVIMWTWIMVFFYLKTDEITKGPCGVCAMQQGEKVTFSKVGTIPDSDKILTVIRTYYPNGTSTTEVLDLNKIINLSAALSGT